MSHIRHLLSSHVLLVFFLSKSAPEQLPRALPPFPCCKSLYDRLHKMTSHMDEMLVPDFSQLQDN